MEVLAHDSRFRPKSGELIEIKARSKIEGSQGDHQTDEQCGQLHAV